MTRALEELAPSFFDLCFDPRAAHRLRCGIRCPHRPRAGSGTDAPPLRAGAWYPCRRAWSRTGPARKSILAPVRYIHTKRKRVHQLGRSTVHDQPPRGWLQLASRSPEGEDRYRDEVTGDVIPFRLGPNRTALSGAIEDTSKFPLTLAGLRFLREGVRFIALSPQALIKPAPPGRGVGIGDDGGNLPFVAKDLQRRDPVLYKQWVRHVALAISGLEDIEIFRRPQRTKRPVIPRPLPRGPRHTRPLLVAIRGNPPRNGAVPLDRWPDARPEPALSD